MQIYCNAGMAASSIRVSHIPAAFGGSCLGFSYSISMARCLQSLHLAGTDTRPTAYAEPYPRGSSCGSGFHCCLRSEMGRRAAHLPALWGLSAVAQACVSSCLNSAFKSGKRKSLSPSDQTRHRCVLTGLMSAESAITCNKQSEVPERLMLLSTLCSAELHHLFSGYCN